jgi:hypothetical protein
MAGMTCPRTVSEIIDQAWGSNRKAADALGVAIELVCNWRAAERFPARKLLVVTRAVHRVRPDWVVSPALFGIEDPVP